MVITGLPVSLAFIQMHNGGILEVLWDGLVLSRGALISTVTLHGLLVHNFVLVAYIIYIIITLLFHVWYICCVLANGGGGSLRAHYSLEAGRVLAQVLRVEGGCRLNIQCASCGGGGVGGGGGAS